jgi:hypothetical protein
MTDTSAEALAALQELEKEGDLKKRLAIVRISEPISLDSGHAGPSPSKRRSDVSVFEDPTPASLEADLTHYKVRATCPDTANDQASTDVVP